MNFLAHCALACDAATTWQTDAQVTQGLVAGALIGDFLKGRIPTDWPSPLARGVAVHRRVDACSNKSIHTRACAERYSKSLRRFAPIFVDLIADYHLCNHWQQHYPQRELASFTQSCYTAIDLYCDYLPEPGKRFFEYMQDEDLLAHYNQWHHLERGINSVLRRLNRKDLAPMVLSETRQVLAACEQDCYALHAQLQDEWQSWTI